METSVSSLESSIVSIYPNTDHFVHMVVLSLMFTTLTPFPRHHEWYNEKTEKGFMENFFWNPLLSMVSGMNGRNHKSLCSETPS